VLGAEFKFYQTNYLNCRPLVVVFYIFFTISSAQDMLS